MKNALSPVIRRRALSLTATAGLFSLALSACAGSAGSSSDGEDAEGYEVGADQDAINEAVKDLDEVEITYQPSAASENSVQAPSGKKLAEAIEKKSNGKIKVKVVWAQAIAGYDELPDALADGRVDLAYALPVYDPAKFPAANALGEALAGLDPSPFVGEMLTNSVAADVSWNTDAIVKEYEDQGLHPLVPVVASGGYYDICNTETSDEEDLKGQQTRIASKSQGKLVKDLGASPVSMAYTETFEALQRGTVDCTLGQLVPSAEAGIFEAAPNIAYTTDTSWSRSPGAMLAGQKFEQLPTTYQQIIFDSYAEYFQGQMMTTVGGNAVGIEKAKEAGGKIQPFSDDVQKTIADFNDKDNAAIEEDGVIGDDITKRVDESAKKWTEKIKELGYADGGKVEDMDDWYKEDTDYTQLGQAVFEEALAEHRPGQ